MEASAELASADRPIAGGREVPSGLDAPAASGGGEAEEPRGSGEPEEAAGNSAAAGTGGDNGGNSAAGLGDGGETSGSEAAGAPDAPEPGEAKEAKDASTSSDAGANGEANPDSNDSAGDEENQDSAGGGIKGFFSSLFGDDGMPEQGDDAGPAYVQRQEMEAAEEPGSPDQGGTDSADGSGQEEDPSPKAGQDNTGRQDEQAMNSSQDTEAADELGAEEADQGQEKSHKGFFARLFGDDESEEDGEAPEDTDASNQPKQPEQSASGKAEPRQGKKAAGKPEDPLQEKRDHERSDSLEASIKYWQGNDKIPESLEDTKKTLTEVLGLGSSFDIVFREMSFAGCRAALLCVSGFAKDTIIDEILKRLTYLTPDHVSTDVFASFMSEYIPHVQVEKGELLSESINKVLSGMSVFFIEGETQVIIMDTRSYPSRSPDEPSIERVVRGARDGFTETLLSNVALVRRRVRDPGLKLEMHQIGRRTRTDVCVAYIDDIVDKTQVQAVTDKLKNVNLDGIPLADKQLEEAIVGGGWNPFPLVRYSERPDIVASHLLEGRVVVIVDTSPSVMVLPTTFFDLCQHAEENRQTPFMGTYLRWVRFIGIFASMFLLPLWMLLVIHPELKPAMLEFIGPQKTAKIPLIAQFLIVELGVDLLRMAAVHTPTPLGSAMGLIAAILVGDIAVQTGLFVNEVVLYMAVAAIGMFATPSYELGLANRIVRLGLLLAVAAFQIPGFMIGSTLLVVLLTTHRSYNSPYMWPFIPFNAKAMAEIILRMPVLSSKTRPSFNKTRDNTRMPENKDAPRKS
nr:spore germination protein [Paenibacillus piscarius]